MEDTPRRIYRSRTDRVFAGVGGGLANYLGIDPVLTRVAFVALGMAGVGVLLYLIAWIAIPEAPEGYVGAPPRGDGTAARFVVGVLLVAAGILYMIDWVFPIGRAFWPLTLIAIGVTIVVYGVKR
jgi:phage shock protein C